MNTSFRLPRTERLEAIYSPQVWGSLPRTGGRPVAEHFAPDDTVASRQIHNIADVQVHQAVDTRVVAARMRAQAFTVGRHIYLGESAPSPSTLAGRSLLRHELGHALGTPPGSGPTAGRAPRRASRSEELRAGRRLEHVSISAETSSSDLVGLEQLFAQVAADQVQSLLRGSGDGDDSVREAIDYLATLDLDDLVDTAIALDGRGELEQVAGGLRFGERSTVAGVLLTAIFLSRRVRETPSWGIAAAQAVAALPSATRTTLLTKVLTATGRGDEVAGITEGLEALTESESFRATAPEEVVDRGASAPTMAGVMAGPWNPGGQPIPFYIGNTAHLAITAFYAAAHATDLAFYNVVPISSIIAAAARFGPTTAGSATAAQLRLRPDIANLTKRHLYEIKPAALQSVGLAEAGVYVAAFVAAGVPFALGATGEPGTVGTVPAPGGWYDFRAPVSGVITYNYRQPPRRRVRVRSTAPEPDPVVDRSLRQRIEDITGLTGIALTIYIIISEGSRIVFPPRNLVPVP